MILNSNQRALTKDRGFTGQPERVFAKLKSHRVSGYQYVCQTFRNVSQTNVRLFGAPFDPMCICSALFSMPAAIPKPISSSLFLVFTLFIIKAESDIFEITSAEISSRLSIGWMMRAKSRFREDPQTAQLELRAQKVLLMIENMNWPAAGMIEV